MGVVGCGDGDYFRGVGVEFFELRREGVTG